MTAEPMADAIAMRRLTEVLESEMAEAAAAGMDAMIMSIPVVASLYETISTLTAERDAAVARAMPEPRLMRTVEEVEALPAYRPFLLLIRGDTLAAVRTIDGRFWTAGGVIPIDARRLVGVWISGPLPDLPTPTTGETP